MLKISKGISRVNITSRIKSFGVFPEMPVGPLSDFLNFFRSELLDPHKGVATFAHPDKFVELRLQGRAVSVLRILDQKQDEKGDNVCPSVHHQLPRIGVRENWTGHHPKQDREHGRCEHSGIAGRFRDKVSHLANVFDIAFSSLVPKDSVPRPSSSAWQ
jgi:hypothetical protein